MHLKVGAHQDSDHLPVILDINIQNQLAHVSEKFNVDLDPDSSNRTEEVYGLEK